MPQYFTILKGVEVSDLHIVKLESCLVHLDGLQP